MVLFQLYRRAITLSIPSKHRLKWALEKTTLKDLLENLELDEDCPSTEYYTPSEVSQVDFLYIHLNISSLSYYIDELHLLLSQMKHRPKIIAISESRIRKNK